MQNLLTSPFARKLASFVALSEPELAEVAAMHKRRRSFVAGRDLVHQGQAGQSAYILAAGWVCSYKLLSDGSRQIVDFQIPGDFLGLRSVLLHTSDHSIESITEIEVSEIFALDLVQSFSKMPRLGMAVLWAASRDEAMVVEHLVGIGRRDAVGRMAHFLLELASRLALVGLGGVKGYDCPLTQYLLADALGLSAVHVNRVLRQLREEGLVTFRDGHVTIHNYKGLARRGDFDEAYLDHSGPMLLQKNLTPTASSFSSAGLAV